MHSRLLQYSQQACREYCPSPVSIGIWWECYPSAINCLAKGTLWYCPYLHARRKLCILLGRHTRAWGWRTWFQGKRIHHRACCDAPWWCLPSCGQWRYMGQLIFNTYHYTKVLNIYCQTPRHVIKFYALYIRLILLKYIIDFKFCLWGWNLTRKGIKYSSDRRYEINVMNEFNYLGSPSGSTADHALSCGSKTSRKNKWILCTFHNEQPPPHRNYSPLIWSYWSICSPSYSGIVISHSSIPFG